jgi:hypothetical protein
MIGRSFLKRRAVLPLAAAAAPFMDKIMMSRPEV